jgi:hypothetical protein
MKALFERVTEHLLRQGCRSVRPRPNRAEGFCAYRGKEGRMCAVGCLITDEAYNDELEGKLSTHFAVQDALVQSGVPKEVPVFEMLWLLQRVHDHVAPEEWPQTFGSLRRVFDGNKTPEDVVILGKTLVLV